MGVGVRRAGRLQKVVVVKDVVFFLGETQSPFLTYKEILFVVDNTRLKKHSLKDFWKDNQRFQYIHLETYYVH